MECMNCGHFAEDHIEDEMGDVHCEGDGKNEDGEWECDCDLFEEEEDE